MKSFPYTPHASSGKVFLLHSFLFLSYSVRARFRQDICFSYNCNDDTDSIPNVMLRPNKDARARSDRLQLGTAHIQSFTQTRQMSVVIGMTRILAAIGS